MEMDGIGATADDVPPRGGSMINVLSHGNQHLQATCPKCGCVFEYESEDVHKERKIVGLISWDVFVDLVKCPECGQSIYI